MAPALQPQPPLGAQSEQRVVYFNPVYQRPAAQAAPQGLFVQPPLRPVFQQTVIFVQPAPRQLVGQLLGAVPTTAQPVGQSELSQPAEEQPSLQPAEQVPMLAGPLLSFEPLRPAGGDDLQEVQGEEQEEPQQPGRRIELDQPLGAMCFYSCLCLFITNIIVHLAYFMVHGSFMLLTTIPFGGCLLGIFFGIITVASGAHYLSPHIVTSDLSEALLSDNPLAWLRHRSSDDPSTCILCCSQPANMTFVHGQSGHTVCCRRCAMEVQKMPGSRCPVCNQQFTAVITNFAV